MNSIDRLIKTINSHRVRSFWLAITFFLITAVGMRPSSACMQTVATPYAIVDLELAFSQATANSIRDLWASHKCIGILSISSNAIEAAIVNIILDFAFICSYTWLLIVLLVLTQSKVANHMIRLTTLSCYAAIIAGSLDVFENIFMLFFLMAYKINSMLFAIPAAIKFILIALLIFWILIRLITMTFYKSKY
jgi:hypothetical protein